MSLFRFLCHGCIVPYLRSDRNISAWYNDKMFLSFFHLNILTGRYLDEVITFVKEKSFDILHFQEVAQGITIDNHSDVFEILKKELDYDGELVVSMRLKDEASSYFGNATLYKKTLSLKQKKVVWLKPYEEFERSEIKLQEVVKSAPRAVLATQFDLPNQMWFVNTHLAWGPTPYDEPYKIEQGKVLTSFLSSLSEPFLLSGDFNVTKDSEIVKDVDRIADNHAVGLTNTLNPRIHRASGIFPPGLAVDYIYTKGLVTSDFALVDNPDLSDHFGLSIKIEV